VCASLGGEIEQEQMKNKWRSINCGKKIAPTASVFISDCQYPWILVFPKLYRPFYLSR
jgi:hypothetical protein